MRHSHYKQYHYKPDHRAYYYDDDPSNCCRRPKARSKIMGVCAGLAKQFGWDVTGVRVVAVLGLIFLTGPTFLAYLIAGVLFY